jgi:hypothetical protein
MFASYLGRRYYDTTANSSQDNTPASTMGFGAREDADATRQAQHEMTNDTPTDVNMNAVVARVQALTFSVSGQSFEANSDFRQKLQDRILAKMTPTA